MGEREAAIINDDRAADAGAAGGEFADTGTTPRAETGHALRASDDDTYDDAADDEADEAARLRAEIEQTRAGMGETIDAIQERLSPENIKEQVMEQVGEAVQSAKDTVREATIGRVEKAMENVSESIGRAGTAVSETGSSIIDTIRQNPLPAALIGLGVGMLVMNRNRGVVGSYQATSTGETGRYRRAPADDYDHDVSAASRYVRRSEARGVAGNVAGRVKDAAGETINDVREAASSAVTRTREQVSRLGDQVQHGARRAGGQFQMQLRENPLAVGAVALALGAAVGLAVPSTRVENEYMGEARDTLVDKAQETARGAMEKVQQVAQDAGRSGEGREDNG